MIPTYNRREIVLRAIESVRRQTFGDFEIVVSDNYSADDTLEHLRALDEPRLTIVQPERHCPLPFNWEAGRKACSGRFVLALSDDDALLPSALQWFADMYEATKSKFLISSLAEYRDASYPGEDRNTLSYPNCTGEIAGVDGHRFLSSVYSFKPYLNMHPSAFVFDRAVANKIAETSGAFFKTNGVEYFGWPAMMAHVGSAHHIDLPLLLLGRTAKSWGVKTVLANPGTDEIQKLTDDAIQERVEAPLKNFAFSNLHAEGMWVARRDFPGLLGMYPKDLHGYVSIIISELEERQVKGVDVSVELAEARAYLATLSPNGRPQRTAGDITRSVIRRAKSFVTTFPGEETFILAATTVIGDDNEFADVNGAANYLDSILQSCSITQATPGPRG